MRRATAKKARLGDLLVERGLITPAQRDEALRQQLAGGRRLGEILVELGFVTDEQIATLLAERAGLPYVALRKGLVDPRIVDIVPPEKARRYTVLPLFKVHATLTLAIGDPNQIFVLDILRKLTGCEIRPVVCRIEDIRRMIEETYTSAESTTAIPDFVGELDGGDIELVATETAGRFEDIAEMAGQSPVIHFVNQVILKAIKERASDIHIEPERKYFRIRFRIDGVLYEVMRQRAEMHAPVVSRLKIMANLDIAERRLPQDGRIQVLAQGHTVDLRFSSLPGVLGEKVVLRVLDRESGVLALDDLGFAPETLCSFRSLLHRPHGLVLATGPTGSGKTTTLYGGLRELNSLERNIVTIEDPVEYQFEVICQNQVREEIGLTFARVLKHTLRQDPDIIMVGEIRDAETAEIAVQAALTGHLVLSTMHTNDAPSSITRLIEMGVEAYLVASSLIGVISQRLLRTVCPDCATAYFPSPSERQALGLVDPSALQLRRGRGCERCFDSGYRGRLGIYELLDVDAGLRRILLENASIDDIRRYLVEHNHQTLRGEGIARVLEGKTTLEEIARAIAID
jgi:type IV pilus assembly protein PilB